MITLRHLDRFLHIGLFSGGNIRSEDISDMAAFKAKNRLVFVSYGSREERGATAARESTSALKQSGINSHYYESPDTAHVWQSWRRSLYQIAPLLFQN